jgi:glucokinase
MQTAIGIDIGGTNTRAARVSADGRIVAHRAVPTARSAEAVVANLTGMIAELRDDTTAAIGVGIPGRVDVRRGLILSGGFVNLSVLPLTQLLQQATGLGVFIDNDANMALAGEARAGAARGFSHAVMLTVGTGIGGAILADGRIFHGGTTAGQLGHITVASNGEPCNCGRHGCLETACSGTALRRLLTEFGFAEGTSITDILQLQTPEAVALVEAWATPLRSGLDSLVAALGPEIVLLGGGLGAAAEQALRRVPARSPWFQYPVAAATLGDGAGVIGAALSALEEVSS